MRTARATAFLAATLWACACTATGDALVDAGYPIEDPLTATIVGTPGKLRADLPEAVPTEVRTLPPLFERRIPAVLEYALPFEYTLTAQAEPAPLVFVIAGTGAGPRSTTSTLLTKILYAAGYHVVALPSPTRVAFMLTAARHPMPGRTTRDVAALYRVMRIIKSRLNEEVPITGYALIGYSLGGLHAAFIAYRDARNDVFNFGRVLLINPVVNLYRSVRRMDALLVEHLPSIRAIPRFLAQALGQIKRVFTDGEPIKFNKNFLFRAYQAADISHRQTAAIVGLAFRLWLANMSFAADLLTNSGVIVPPKRELGIADSLEPYLLESFAMSYQEYINKLLLPYYNRGPRHLTRQRLIWEGKLQRIGDFLAQARNIAVITNADDPILGERGLAFLRETFGERATIFKNGGHLGNLAYKPVVAVIQQYFRP